MTITKLNTQNTSLFQINLKKIMKLRNISDSTLAKLIGVPQSTIHRLLNGSTADPRASTMVSIAKVLDVNIETLITDNHEGFLNKIAASNVMSIPILKWEQAINYKESIKGLNADNWNSWITIESDLVESTGFALRSKPSMQPRFPNNSILIFNPNIKPIDGDYILMLHSLTDSLSLRLLADDGNKFISHSIIPGGESITINKVNINIATLVESRNSRAY